MGSAEGVGSLGSSGSWTLLASQLLKCETEMRRRSMYSNIDVFKPTGAVQVSTNY